ncbi:extracellular calcium-sensing receptor-like [Protopterus annectens]|uniref:extracellular calcium-sensing receptor-like n=1 Tax=Protopterus annectens TaxID=7888 RepID=UPI001CFB9D55|nr:extracellular calcium-sensing receptor-like [Protopterus annectens]
MKEVMMCRVISLLAFMRGVTQGSQMNCKLNTWNMESYWSKGTLQIGGIFPVIFKKDDVEISFTKPPNHVHCETFELRRYRWIQSLIFTVQEINQNPYLLPNVTLGYGIFDSCNAEARALKGVMYLLSGKQDQYIPNYHYQTTSPLVAVIGDMSSQVSIQMARVLGIYRVPHLAYGASAVVLSDKKTFPSFLRVYPSDRYLCLSLAKLVAYFKWTWVGIVAEETDYGAYGSQMVKEELAKLGVCIAFSEMVSTVYSEKRIKHTTKVIKESSAKGIVMYFFQYNMYSLVEEIARQNITEKIWLASEPWSLHEMLSENNYFKVLNGTIIFSVWPGEIQGLKQFLLKLHPFSNPNDIFIHTFWEHVFGCKWTYINNNESKYGDQMENQAICTGYEDLRTKDLPFFDMSTLRYTYKVHIAVQVIVHTLQNLMECTAGSGPFKNGSCSSIDNLHTWQLLHFMKNVNFRMKSGENIFFDANGDPPAIYELLIWQINLDKTSKYFNIGRVDFSSEELLTLNKSAFALENGELQFPHSVCSESCSPGYRKVIQDGQPSCCFDCIPCSTGEISNKTDSNDCLRCSDEYSPNEHRDTCIRRSIDFLSYEEPLGVVLMTLSIVGASMSVIILYIFIKNKDTPIVKANNRELSYLLLLALMLCFLCSLLFIGHPVTTTCMLRQVVFAISFALCVSCILAKTTIVIIAFRATNPSSKLRRWIGPAVANTIVVICTLMQAVLCAAWLAASHPFPENNTKSQIQMIIIECNEGSYTAFWLVLCYMGLLASASFIMAFLSRNLPDSFNEARFITFSMLVFLSVWLTFIPAHLSTKGKLLVAVEIFAILSSSTGLLVCIFIPKCIIILLKPANNSRDFLMKRYNAK